MWCFRYVIYPMYVSNLACAGTCKSDCMPASFRPVIFNSVNFFLIFKGCFNKHGLQVWMSVKLATLGLLNIKILWNKGYDIAIFAHDITNKSLSYDSNYIVNMVLWPKIGNSSFSKREILRIWPKEIRGVLNSTSIIWE